MGQAKAATLAIITYYRFFAYELQCSHAQKKQKRKSLLSWKSRVLPKIVPVGLPNDDEKIAIPSATLP